MPSDTAGPLCMPTTAPEETILSQEAKDTDVGAALSELKTRVQTLEEKSCFTLEALAVLQKSRPATPLESSISCSPLRPPSLPESVTPGTASSELPGAEARNAGSRNGDSDPSVLGTLEEMKSLLQLLDKDLDLIASRRSPHECSACGLRKDTKLASTDTVADCKTTQLLEELKCGVLTLVDGFRQMATCGAKDRKNLSAPLRRQESCAVSECPPSPQPVDAATRQVLGELKTGIQVLTEEFCKFKNQGVCRADKSPPNCRSPQHPQVQRTRTKAGKLTVCCKCHLKKNKPTKDAGIRNKTLPCPTRCGSAFSIAPLRPQAVAYPERCAGVRQRPATRLEDGRPLWVGARECHATSPPRLPQADCALERLPRASVMTVIGQEKTPSSHESSVHKEVSGASSAIAVSPSAPTNTPVPEEEMEVKGREEVDFPVGAESRQNSNARLKWIALAPVSVAGESGNWSIQHFSGEKPEKKLRGFRISYKKARPLGK
nr:unnamed protein product [Spirometra erinaceieuropaei]